MKLGFKRLLAGIALTGISLFAKADAKFDYYGDYFTLIENNHKYSGRRVANRQEKVAGWYIVDITDKNNPNVIGDEKREIPAYRRKALEFTMYDYMPKYIKTIRSTKNTFEKIWAAQLGTEALRFVYDELVGIEGSLMASLVTGGASLSGEAQKYVVRNIVGSSVDTISKNFNSTLKSRYSEIEEKVKTISSNDLKKILSGEESNYVEDLEKILLEEIDKSVHTQLLNDINTLKEVEKYFSENKRNQLNDSKMYEAMVYSMSQGFGIAAYYNEINKNNRMDNLARTIIIKGTQTAGVPITSVIKNDKLLKLLQEEDYYQNAVKKGELKQKEIERMLRRNFDVNWEGQSVNRFLDYLQKSKEEPQKEIINLYREGVQNIDLDCNGTKEKIEIIKIEDLKGHPNFNSLSKIFINDKPTTTESFCGESVYLKKNKGKCEYYLIRVYSTTDTKPYTTNCFGDDTPYVWNGKTFRKR